jgi:hypothetical protein
MTITRSLQILVCAAALSLPLRTASAAEAGGCDAFAWPIATELQWMTAPESAAVASGAKLPSLPEKAVALALQPMSQIVFPVAPTSRRKGDPDATFGGIDSSDGAEPGLYQVTLATGGWIDVVQDGKALKSAAHTGKTDCDGARKSVRFGIGPGPFSVELSGFTADTAKFTIRRAE